MLIPSPLLVRGKAEPTGRAILIDDFRGVGGSEVFVGIPLRKQHPGFMGPFLIAKKVEVVSEVPGDVREGSEPRDGIADEAMLVITTRCRINFAVAHLQH